MASVFVPGDVSPCSFLGSSFDAGNIRTRSFEAVWRAGHAFRRLCRPEMTDAFGGGCRARAQFYSGSAYAEDPWQAQHDGKRTVVRRLPLLGTEAP